MSTCAVNIYDQRPRSFVATRSLLSKTSDEIDFKKVEIGAQGLAGGKRRKRFRVEGNVRQLAAQRQVVVPDPLDSASRGPSGEHLPIRGAIDRVFDLEIAEGYAAGAEHEPSPERIAEPCAHRLIVEQPRSLLSAPVAVVPGVKRVRRYADDEAIDLVVVVELLP